MTSLKPSERIELKKKLLEEKGIKIVKERTCVRKIDSPLAKYNNLQQLICILCDTVIKNEGLWTAHVNGRNHKDNVKILRQQIKNSDENISMKRKLSENASPSEPKEKISSFQGIITDDNIDHNNVQTKKKFRKSMTDIADEIEKEMEQETMDITDSIEITESNEISNVPSNQTEVSRLSMKENHTIPEGFFDDPQMDAKIRKVDFLDPLDEEWEKFQKMIREETNVSQAIQEEDQLASVVERHLEEVEEQMRFWSRVLKVEFDRDKIRHTKNEQDPQISSVSDNSNVTEDINNSSDSETDYLFNWRSKAT